MTEPETDSSGGRLAGSPTGYTQLYQCFKKIFAIRIFSEARPCFVQRLLSTFFKRAYSVEYFVKNIRLRTVNK
jgi:hypothetical protein